MSNNKAPERKGKVQLIDAGLLYRKLRKNLGNKNCEFAPEHIREIVSVYSQMQEVKREIHPETKEEMGIAAQVFDNSDFGYYKVTIERPKRLMAQFTEERIAELRFDKSLREPMVWAYETFEERVYSDLHLLEKDILDWCEKQELNLNAKQKRALTDPATWNRQRELLQQAHALMQQVGNAVYDDFNLFSEIVDASLKGMKAKLTAAEKNALLNAVSWYDEKAEKVVKAELKLNGNKLEELLDYLGCTVDNLPDYGYYPTEKAGIYITYESESELRDTENIPLKENIHDYFLREVKPHVSEAWINMDATKIGYEISFNKYFYRHKPLRSLEEVTTDILALEAESDGLIKEILGDV